jgi:meso-butanediol dehydrogenase / (S,S)-butanediol dehydrogenase / diacetyl reductase
VRVNVVAPGDCETPGTMAFLEGPAGAKVRAEAEGKVPMGRMGSAEEVAHAVLFLASDASSYCTGVSLAVDGGYTMV